MKLNVKHFFLEFSYLILFYFVMWNFVFLVFTLVDLMFFSGSRDLFFLMSGSFFKFNLASLLVAAPMFFVLVEFMRRSLDKDSEMKNGKLRKLSIYLTLFVSGFITMIDLITLIYSYLNGSEITIAFVIKSVFILILFTLVFVYFIQDLRGYWGVHTKRRKAILHPFMTFIIASIIFSLFAVGNPKNQKMLKYDLDKMRDLSALEGSVKAFYYDTGNLPRNVKEMKNFNSVMRDPQTGKSYKYNKINNNTFELCADFNLNFPEVSNIDLSSVKSSWLIEEILNLKDKWDHKAGNNCFTLKVERNASYKKDLRFLLK